jgi:hypothetical protein
MTTAGRRKLSIPRKKIEIQIQSNIFFSMVFSDYRKGCGNGNNFGIF